MEFYKKIAIRLQSYVVYLFVTGIGLIITGVISIERISPQMTFTLMTVGFWCFGLALIANMFKPVLKVKNYGEREYTSKMQEASPILRGYITVFISCWFLGLVLFSFKVIHMWVISV